MLFLIVAVELTHHLVELVHLKVLSSGHTLRRAATLVQESLELGLNSSDLVLEVLVVEHVSLSAELGGSHVSLDTSSDIAADGSTHWGQISGGHIVSAFHILVSSRDRVVILNLGGTLSLGAFFLTFGGGGGSRQLALMVDGVLSHLVGTEVN